MSDVPVDRRQLTLQARPVDARTLQVTVADHGHGLAGVDMEKIFAPSIRPNRKAWVSAWPSVVLSSSFTRAGCGSATARRRHRVPFHRTHRGR